MATVARSLLKYLSRILSGPVLVALVVITAVGPAEARGWEEIHQTSDDVRVEVGGDGVALVEHHLRYRVVAGRFATFDLPAFDSNEEITQIATIRPENGGEIVARVEPHPKVDGLLRVAFDPSRGVGRGVYVVDVSARLDLVKTKRLTRDGAMWRLSWTAPSKAEGQDGARVVFVLPPAPTEPRLALADEAQTILPILRREPDRDELELVRAHVPRGEAVAWSIRVDPKAFPRVSSPELRPPIRSTMHVDSPNHASRALLVAAFSALAGALALLLRAKRRFVAEACEVSAVQPRPLLPIPFGAAPLLYGIAVALGLVEMLWGTPIHGAGSIAVAMAIAAHRLPVRPSRPRGPGRFRPIADEEVLVARDRPRSPGDALDIGTTTGKVSALATCAVVFAMGYALRGTFAGALVAVPLAATALVPLFVTGGRAQLPRMASDLAVAVLAPTRDALARIVDLAHVDVRCIARYSERGSSYDEVRLSCIPKVRVEGLRGIELALAASRSTPAVLPEVLVRFDDGSPAATVIARIARGLPVVTGRLPEEKVLRIAPRHPTPEGSARLLARLLTSLERQKRDKGVARASRQPGPRVSSPASAASSAAQPTG